ncbi:MAG: DinB family protein [Acidimicrobiia bacterium]
MKRTGGERELLLGFIELNRRTVLWKLDGLTEEQARRRVVGSETTLLGIVNHLAHVERYWIQSVIAGRSIEFPWTDENPDAEWIMADHQTIDSVRDHFETEVAIGDAILAGEADLEREIIVGERTLSVRWILIHLVEEIARHAGHADIIREIIDETTGYFPPPPIDT